jgi:hypothetical protein
VGVAKSLARGKGVNVMVGVTGIGVSVTVGITNFCVGSATKGAVDEQAVKKNSKRTITP